MGIDGEAPVRIHFVRALRDPLSNREPKAIARPIVKERSRLCATRPGRYGYGLMLN